MVEMVHISALWLPILLAGVFVFIASSIIHMMPLWHKNECPKVPNEDKVMDALRPFQIPPGDYFLPRASGGKEMRSPEFVEKMKKGPVMMLSVWPNGPANMGKSLTLWFLYTLVVGVFAAYISGRALPPGTDYLHVFRFAGATAFIAYAVGTWQMSIWYNRPWKTTFWLSFDGLIYGLLTGGTFGWLWPHSLM